MCRSRRTDRSERPLSRKATSQYVILCDVSGMALLSHIPYSPIMGSTLMRRREFITLLGSATVASPIAARAQQPERMRRIGILLPAAADDAEYQARLGAFLQGLALLG